MNTVEQVIHLNRTTLITVKQSTGTHGKLVIKCKTMFRDHMIFSEEDIGRLENSTGECFFSIV